MAEEHEQIFSNAGILLSHIVRQHGTEAQASDIFLITITTAPSTPRAQNRVVASLAYRQPGNASNVVPAVESSPAMKIDSAISALLAATARAVVFRGNMLRMRPAGQIGANGFDTALIIDCIKKEES